jgi:hypothetical protein
MPIPEEKFEKQEGVRWLLDHIDQPVREVEGSDYQAAMPGASEHLTRRHPKLCEQVIRGFRTQR